MFAVRELCNWIEYGICRGISLFLIGAVSILDARQWQFFFFFFQVLGRFIVNNRINCYTNRITRSTLISGSVWRSDLLPLANLWTPVGTRLPLLRRDTTWNCSWSPGILSLLTFSSISTPIAIYLLATKITLFRPHCMKFVTEIVSIIFGPGSWKAKAKNTCWLTIVSTNLKPQ